MSGGTVEIHRDDEPLITGTHDGADAATTLRDLDMPFRSLGARVDLAIENETQGTSSHIATVTEAGEITTDDAISWDNGDVYNIYKTATKGAIISTNWVDTSRGWKSRESELIDGWRAEDVDLDRDGQRIFGPGQPEKSHGGD